MLVWQKGDDVLTAQSIMVSPDRRFKLLPDHTLELRNINPRDGGDYSCKISVLGDPIEITHTLEILRKSINPVIFFVSKRRGGFLKSVILSHPKSINGRIGICKANSRAAGNVCFSRFLPDKLLP